MIDGPFWSRFPAGVLKFGLVLSAESYAVAQTLLVGWSLGWVPCFILTWRFSFAVAGTPSPKAAVLANGDHGTEGEGPAGEWLRVPVTAPWGGRQEACGRCVVGRGAGSCWEV